MSKEDEHDSDHGCSFNKLLIFVAALAAGTVCSLSGKALLSMESTGMTGETEPFSYPLFQTFGMFLGMTGGLLLHILVIQYSIPFPGYTHRSNKGYSAVGDTDEESASITNRKPETKPLPTHMYFLLIVPAIFDLVATSLATYGLRYVTVSVYQMLRGSAIVFVAILKQFVLKDLLTRYQWVGIAINCISIVLVGFTAMMIEASTQAANETAGDSGDGEALGLGGGTAIIGVVLILLGALVQSVQYVFEEKVMSADDNDPDVAPTPPLLLIGMEGLWGLLICVCIMYPVAYYYPGEDHGSFENPFNTWVMLSNSLSVQLMFAVYFIAILLYNILACLVTYELDSVWHAILDNFRPATVWGADLLIFYCVTAAFGEPWNQPWSLLQLLGMFVLLYGTAIYNAPNPGSIKLTGDAVSCFIDCSEEYEQRLPVLYVSSSSDLPTPTSSSSSSKTMGEVVCAANPSPYYGELHRHRSTASRWGGVRRRLQIDAAQRTVADAGGQSLGVQRHGDKLFYVVLKAAQKAAENLDASNPTGEISPFHKNRSYVVSSDKSGSIALNKTNYGAAGVPPAR